MIPAVCQQQCSSQVYHLGLYTVDLYINIGSDGQFMRTFRHSEPPLEHL